MSGFLLKFLKRVQFCEKIIYFKVSPKSTTYNSHNVFFQKTMYDYNLQYYVLDNTTCHSNSSLRISNLISLCCPTFFTG